MPDYGTMIQKAYVAYFGRPADAVGYQYWLNGLTSGALTVEDMYMHFAASQEYLSNYAGMSDAQIISAVYLNLFNRAPDPDGLLYWAGQMGAGWVTIDNVVMAVLGGASNVDANDLDTINNKVAASAAFTAALDETSEILGYSGDVAAAKAKDWLAGITDNDAALNDAIVHINDTIADVITPDSTTPVILTTGQDVLTGGAGNDTFRSTQATLQMGDDLDGGAGSDKLTVSIAGSGISLDGFATTSVETIEVKSISTSASTLDLSDVVGLTTLVSRETDGASLTFRDIQSVNDVNISIIDTDETHNFGYDLNAYTSGVDNVDLRLEEVRDAEINFFNTNGSTALGVEKISIDSETILDPSIGRNLVSDLNVGDYLKTVMIKGNADFEVAAPLDPFISLVDAQGLNAKLTLDMSEEDPSVPLVTFRGAQDDTYITFGSAANAKSITTYGGDDTILAGQGNNTISSGACDDYIEAGSGNDSIDAGSGNDTVRAGEGNNTVNGGENDDLIYSGAGNDNIIGGTGNDTLYDLGGNNTISMGDGSDEVILGTVLASPCIADITVADGMGNNSIDLGTGNDILWIDAKELEVADTITGNEGLDTMVICNVTGRIDYGQVLASETQRTTSIETFDLRDAAIYFTLTDNLIESAQDNSVTVVTENSCGTQTVDITNITAPVYNFTLEGSYNRDIVIADDMTVNSMSTMRFDHDSSTEGNSSDSTADTLVVIDSANISATDTLNITGLENIVLKGNSIWTIDITDALIEQTSVNSDLIIKVDSTVPAGSKLYLNTVGPISATENVYIYRNSNVTVYLNGTQIIADGVALDYDGSGAIIVDTPLEFTENADSLVGTSGDDTFYASSPDQLDLSDFADGLGHLAGDRLVLGAGVYSGDSIWQQMNFVELNNIEILEFSEDVGYGVHFADDNSVDYDVHTYILTNADDKVTNALDDRTFWLRGGNDSVQFDDGADNITVHGGLGNDTVDMWDNTGSYSTASVSIEGVETVYGGDGNDTVNILNSNNVPVWMSLYDGDDSVDGSDNGDVITVYGGDGNDTVDGNNGADNIYADQVELVRGGNDNDTISAYDDETASNDSVYGQAGNDNISATNFEDIGGGTGADVISVFSDFSSGNTDTIWGDETNPTLDVSSWTSDTSLNNDTINLIGNVGRDTVVFGTEVGRNVAGTTLYGNAAHPTGFNVTVSSGFDTITGFTARAVSLPVEDLLDVSNLLGNGGLDIDTVDFANSVGGDHNFNGGSLNNIIIAWNAPTDVDGNIVLDEHNFTIDPGADGDNVFRLEDNGEAVLALTSATDPDNVTELELFYVCDTDYLAGASWNIVKIGVVTFDGNGMMGLSGASFENNFVVA